MPKARLPRRARPESAKDRRDAGQPRSGRVPTEAEAPEDAPVRDANFGNNADDGFNGGDLIVPSEPNQSADGTGANDASASDAGDEASATDPVAGTDGPAVPPRPQACKDLPPIDPAAIEEADRKEATLSPEMASAFLRFRQSKMSARSSRVALAMSKLMRIRLPYPRQIEGMGELEELRLLGLEMQGEQQLALTIFERTGCGKSTLAQQYKLMRNMEKPDSVLHARMGTSGSARDLWVSVMSELGDGFASAGNEHSLRRRAMQAMEDAGVELLILDETQHSGQKTGFSKDVTAELKIMLDTGKVPIVLLGTEKAVPLFAADRELAGRMFAPCRLAPLEMTDDDDFDLWCDMLQDLDARMVADGILSQPFGLDREAVAEALGEICEGIIGQLMRVMLMAVRNTVRDDRRVMTMQDLVFAVDEWSRELGFSKTNPLRNI